jgi:hypothetical protein
MSDKTKAELEAENKELIEENSALTAEVEKLTSELEAATAPIEGTSKVEPPKIALVSRTGQPRNRGGYIIPATEPIVLAIADIDPRDLRAVEGDSQVLKVRSDSPITTNVERFDNSAEREHYS